MSDALDGLELGEELFWEPMRAVPPDPWAGHIPLAFWLMKVLRPRLLVELGTHTGNSYFAFCQAVAGLNLTTRCFAVDTWRGDEHAGWYGEEVFEDVSSFNGTHFAHFSTLLRTTFAEARPYFADGSVDLLHIDGMHGYEAVRNDFEIWQSALSECAVVLLHDVNVRERDFGVWRLWEELSVRFPAFAFDHSHGLGVLGVGPKPPPALTKLFALKDDPVAAAMVRRRIASRGDAFRRRVEIQLLEDQVSLLSAAVEARVRKLDQLGHEAAESARWKDELIAARDQVIRAQREMLRLAQAALQGRDAAIQARDRVIQSRDELMRDAARASERQAREQTAEHADNVRRSTAALGELHQKLDELYQELDRIAAERAQLAAAHAEACRARDRFERKYRKGRKTWVTAPVREVGKLWRSALGKTGPSQNDRVSAGEATTPTTHLEAPQLVAAPLAIIDAVAPGAPTPSDPKVVLRGLLATRLDAFLGSGARLELPRSDRPEVSIVLVLHNQAELTFGCLTSILESRLSGDPLPAEVVILDNGSEDATGALLDRLDGALILRMDENLHFLHGVNHAVRSVRGTNLLLLNNDAQLLPGAVQSALRTLSDDPTIGAVGGRIILPNGTLQEAGSIVWNDGTCLGYGRGRTPNDPEFMFRRDVDYCSGAFLLTPTALFRRLGGFDERYAPAYYEETDYCVRLWKEGLRVVFEPQAAVLHLEFGSAAVDSGEAMALQQRNWRRFVAAHAEWLRGQLPPSQLNELPARKARPARQAKRVLMLEDRMPKPMLGSGYPRARDILHELVAAGAEVTFYPMYRHRESWPEVRSTVGPTVETFILGSSDQLGPFLESRRGYYDALLVCRWHNMRRLVELEGVDPTLIGDARVIYDAEAVFARRDVLRERTNGREVAPEDASARVADEVVLTRLAHTVLSVSDAERQLFEDHGVAPVVRLGHAVEVTPTPAPFAERAQILFLGAVHDDNSPNADALRWFADAMLPILRQRLGREDLRLTVVGLNQAATIAARDGKDLDLIGPVDDLAAHLNQARLMVVPTRFAAGMPHKVHQAAALGVPIVATELIAAQVGWEDGRELLAADDAVSFADACARLFTDETLWMRIRQGALERCRRECSPGQFRRTVRELLDSVPLRPRLCEAGPATAAATMAAVPDYVGRGAESDYSVAVPFGYIPSPASRPASVAVICHLFHAELAEEIRRYLRNIPVPADLFLSTDSEAKRAALAVVFEHWTGGTVDLRVMPNRGRDIAPKLVGFREVHERYHIVLHLHSKMSRHDQGLGLWRTFLLESLLGSPAIVHSVFETFARLPQIGIVYPQYYEYIRHWLDWGANFPAASRVAESMGMNLRANAALDFPTGSMFWARGAALTPLLGLNLTFEDFPVEAGQTDGTLAHAIERLYLHACERAGYGWLKIANPALYFNTDTIVPIRSAEDLDRYVAKHCLWLSGPGAPPAAERPPLRPAVPPGLLAVVRARQAPEQEAA
jgi:GT2 family glycosyltransferase/glycosyltransferase involved in cell wall biosynthesis